MKTAITSVLALVLALGTAAAQEATQEEIEKALAEHDGSEVLAKVGERQVTLSDAALTFSTLPAEMQRADSKTVLDALTEQLIAEYALLEQATKAGIEENPDVKARLEAARRATLAEAYVAGELRARVTDDLLREQYEEAIKSFPEEEEVRARHILVETEEEAQEIVQQLEGGADFAELAAERSTGPSGASGGDLGYFLKGDMVGPFAEAAFALEPGSISNPVQTQFGWHVITVEDKRMRQPPAFEELEVQLRNQMMQSTAQEIIAEAREAVEVEKIEETPPAFLIRQEEMFSQ